MKVSIESSVFSGWSCKQECMCIAAFMDVNSGFYTTIHTIRPAKGQVWAFEDLVFSKN